MAYISFSPIIDINIIFLLAAFIAVITLAVFIKNRSLAVWRFCAAAFMLLVLLNPSIIEEERNYKPDIISIVIDKSQSQDFGQRAKQAKEALEYIKSEIDNNNNLEYRISYSDISDGDKNETRLFKVLEESFSDIPKNRRAGSILITDGQVHDVPSNIDDFTPIHSFITGEKNEKDRRIVILKAPSYAITGKDVTVRYKIEDSGNIDDGKYATVIIKSNDDEPEINHVVIGKEYETNIAIEHAGQNIVSLEVQPVEDELTKANNKAAIIINGLRDRLKVLLVSGEPHMGERTWRSLLGSDPGVDLIHFTILREPNKINPTRSDELSLIAFPFRELFEEKLYSFDLVIFDRYRMNQIMPSYYYSNVADYVKKGGALLISSGPAFIGKDSTAKSRLRDIIPALPSGIEYKGEFTPYLTEIGKMHPVTKAIDNEKWGPWLWQADILPSSGDVLMNGHDGKALLVIDRVGKGRIAQIASDQIWLWSKNYKGGGPQAELLKRLSHWLMKEPELEENALNVQIAGNNIIIKKRTMDNKIPEVEMTKPDGSKLMIDLKEDGFGWYKGQYKADDIGVYSFDDKENKRFAVYGDINPKELSNVVASDKILSPVSDNIIWLSNNKMPKIKVMKNFSNNTRFSGNNWIGFKNNGNYSVTKTSSITLLPVWLTLLLLIFLTSLAWWREGK